MGTGGGLGRRLIGQPAISGGAGVNGSTGQRVVVNEGLPAAEQAGGAGGQVGMVEDGQLHRQTAPHAGRGRQRRELASCRGNARTHGRTDGR